MTQANQLAEPLTYTEQVQLAERLTNVCYQSIKQSPLFDVISNTEWDEMADELARKVQQTINDFVIDEHEKKLGANHAS